MGQFQSQFAGVVNQAVRQKPIGNVIKEGKQTADLTKLPSFKAAKAAADIQDGSDYEIADDIISGRFDPNENFGISPKFSFEDWQRDYDAVRQFQYEAKLVQDRQYMNKLFALIAMGGIK